MGRSIYAKLLNIAIKIRVGKKTIKNSSVDQAVWI